VILVNLNGLNLKTSLKTVSPTIFKESLYMNNIIVINNVTNETHWTATKQRSQHTKHCKIASWIWCGSYLTNKHMTQQSPDQWQSNI